MNSTPLATARRSRATAEREHARTHLIAPRRRIRTPAAGVFGAAMLLATVGCGGGDGDSGPNLSAAPTQVRWQPFQGVALPNAAQGPKKTANGAATGFEQSPSGAALAAIVHTVRLSIAADSQWPDIVRLEVVPDKARDEWSVNRLQLSITGPASPEYAPRLLGYKITSYTDAASAVDVYTEYSDSSKAVNHTTVEWFGNDWRLRLPDQDPTARPIESVDELPTDIVKLEAPA